MISMLPDSSTGMFSPPPSLWPVAIRVGRAEVVLGEGLRPEARLGVRQQRLKQQGEVSRVGVDPRGRRRIEDVDGGDVAVAGDLLQERPRLAVRADDQLGAAVGLAQRDRAQTRVGRARRPWWPRR